MSQLNQLLNEAIGELRGIVLRYIPINKACIYDARHFRGSPNQELIQYNGREMVKETTANSHGGKWLAQWSNDRGNTTMWHKSEYIIADTPEDAVSQLINAK